jgi:hypothetical protein
MDRVTAFILRLAVTAMIAAALSFAMRAAQAAPPDMPPGCLLAVSDASPAHQHHAGHGMPAEAAQFSASTQDAGLAPSCCASPCMNALVPPAMLAGLPMPAQEARSPPALTVPPGTDPDRLTRPPALLAA